MTDTAPTRDVIAEYIENVEEMWFLPEQIENAPENPQPHTVLMMRHDMAIMLGMLKTLHMLHARRARDPNMEG